MDFKDQADLSQYKTPTYLKDYLQFLFAVCFSSVNHFCRLYLSIYGRRESVNHHLSLVPIHNFSCALKDDDMVVKYTYL